MTHSIKTLRFLISTIAISIALALVGVAQTASGTSTQAMTKSASSDHVAKMVADWTRAKEYTKEYLDAMPEDGMGFKPTPEIRSFAEQMLHLTAANFLFASTATGLANPYDKKNLEAMSEYKTKAALTKIVMESYDFMIKAIQGFDLSKSGEAVKFFNFSSTRGELLAKCFEHQTHHRGQTTIYLRLKGVKPPQEKLF